MKCSIVITTFNKPGTLDLVLKSIFCQKVPFCYEVIVVDDGGVPDTFRICSKYSDRIVFIRTGNKQYRNPARARNVGYLAAKGDVLICQCDDVIHITENSIERLVEELKEGEFLLAKTENWAYSGDTPSRYIRDYCSQKHRPVPYFFLGAIRRSDLYAVGGNDNEFVEPCYDDDWFADCLIKGLGLKPRHDDSILAHHIAHPYPQNSHVNESASKQLYEKKKKEASLSGIYQSSGGPWVYSEEEDYSYIPKCMNFFWTASPLSWLRYLTVRSFRQLHPDWGIRFYVCDVPGEKYSGFDWKEKLDTLDVDILEWSPPVKELSAPHASDLFQWEILSKSGGFYSDMDILYVRPLDYASLRGNDAIFCNSSGHITIGFLASCGENAIFEELYDEALRGYSKSRPQSTGAEAAYRLAGIGDSWGQKREPAAFYMRYLEKKYPEHRICELNPQVVYPWTWRELDRIWEKDVPVPDNCVGIHWFGGSDRSRQLSFVTNSEQAKFYKCTLTKYAKYYV